MNYVIEDMASNLNGINLLHQFRFLYVNELCSTFINFCFYRNYTKEQKKLLQKQLESFCNGEISVGMKRNVINLTGFVKWTLQLNPIDYSVVNSFLEKLCNER